MHICRHGTYQRWGLTKRIESVSYALRMPRYLLPSLLIFIHFRISCARLSQGKVKCFVLLLLPAVEKPGASPNRGGITSWHIHCS